MIDTNPGSAQPTPAASRSGTGSTAHGWTHNALPAMRRESPYGDRIVRCFAQRPASVHAMLRAAVGARPDACAVACGDARWSWRELEAQVARLAGVFAARGIVRGERVGMLIGNRVEFIAIAFALQRLGAIGVPIGVREQRPGLAYMLAQCGAAAIVFDAELGERVPDAAEVTSLRLRIAVEELVGLEAPAVSADDAAPVAETDVAFILYTSGTTGHPKGAMLTHLSIAHSVMHFQTCWQLGPDERAALAVPASHVTGLVAIILTMAHVGGTTVVVPQFKAAEFVALLARERVTYSLMVPAMYALCLMQPAFGTEDLSAWRIAGYGGAPMPVATIDALAERLPGLHPVNAYGATETTSPATVMPIGATRAHIDSVGVAAPCAELICVDSHGRELAAGEAGELWIGGPMVVPGYWADPAATARAFTAGYWHSGDVGSIDAHGFVRVFDRQKDMLNRGGFKVYSAEVEGVLMGLPGVTEAAVVGKPCPVLGERVLAFVHAPGTSLTEQAVRAHCARQLADYKVPEAVVFEAEPLPRNANGKLLKRVLRERIERALGEPSPDKPSGPPQPSA